MRVAVSSSHFVSAAPCSSGGGLLTLFPCSNMGSLSWETVLHKLLQQESFPQGPVLQGQAAPPWVPHRVTSPARKPTPVCTPLFPWGHRSCQQPAPAWASHGVTASFGHPPALVWGPPWTTGGYLLHCGPPWTAWEQPASPWSSPPTTGECLLQHLGNFLPLLLH